MFIDPFRKFFPIPVFHMFNSITNNAFCDSFTNATRHVYLDFKFISSHVFMEIST